jgi:AraC-like DNA-binding protein
MRILEFDSSILPAADRLAAFRVGAADFQIDAVGDPLAFAASWRLLVLGDLNAIEASISPVRYLRDQARIDADQNDRVAMVCHATGSSHGTLGGREVEADPDRAMIWDLGQPLDIRSDGPSRVWIVTMPRYLLHEVLPDPSPGGLIDSGPELSLAISHLRYLFGHAGDLPNEAAAFYGRSVRNLFAAAMLPEAVSDWDARRRSAPLLQLIGDLIDRRPGERLNPLRIARELDVSSDVVNEALRRMGGLAALSERRRLLSAYRLLSNPAVTTSVSQIAARCGFTDLPRFSRRFRDVFEASATEIRRQRVGRLPRWAGAYDIERNYAALIKRERSVADHRE